MRNEAFLALAALAVLSGCDCSERADLLKEREAAQYQAAMADYKAGRVEQAIAGFKKVCREDPANASARFQLACLLQDGGRDHFGAYCSYREFLVQHPESDKSALARKRMEMCEREAAKELAEKHGLSNVKAMTAEIEALQRQLKDSEKRNVKLSDDVAVTMQRVAHLLAENAKLKAAIKGGDGSEKALASAGVKSARALLDEDDGDRMTIPEEARRLRDEKEEPVTDRIKASADVASLRREGEEDEKLGGPALLPPHPPATNAVRKALPPAQPARADEPKHEKRPESYVVQDGDTLYKIAMRFYGRSSAWKMIREANKATITTDGRVKKGMTIKLPDPQ